MLNERIKMEIAVQKRAFLLDATRRDQRINGLLNRYPEGPELAEVPCRLKRDVFAGATRSIGVADFSPKSSSYACGGISPTLTCPTPVTAIGESEDCQFSIV